MASVFTASIEPVNGRAYIYGAHLGTDEAVARKCCEDLMALCFDRHGGPMTVRTIGLIKDGALFDVFDGDGWDSDDPLDREFD